MQKPQRLRGWCTKIIKETYPQYSETSEVLLFGCRGYFRDSMGKVGSNDRGIFAKIFLHESEKIRFDFCRFYSVWNGRGLSTRAVMLGAVGRLTRFVFFMGCFLM